MCGIVGAAGKLTGKDEKAVRHMMIVNAVRGSHSTGVAVIPKTLNEYKIAKVLGGPFSFFDSKQCDKAFAGSNAVVIGHGRHATRGAVNLSNAHPFEQLPLIGVHNGTLENKYQLEKHGEFGTDSETLYRFMSKTSPKEALETARGAFALVWWDMKEKRIFFARNDNRPLFMLYNEDKTVMYWASEKRFFDFVIADDLIKPELKKDGTPNYLVFEKEKIYSTEIPLGQKECFDGFHIEEYAEAKKLPISSNYSGMGGRHYGKKGSSQTTKGVGTTKTGKGTTSEAGKKSETLNFSKAIKQKKGMYQIFGNVVVSPAKAKELLQQGCYGCGEKTDFKKIETVHWYNGSYHICDDCYTTFVIPNGLENYGANIH